MTAAVLDERQAMNVASLSEAVASKELKGGVYDIWATADGDYDESSGRLDIQLDCFVRPADIRVKDSRIRMEWLPNGGKVSEHVGREEAVAQTKEVFQSWIRKVRRHIPETFAPPETTTIT